MDIITEKKCSRCKQVKPKSLFYRNNNRKDKLTPWCADCYKLSQKNISKEKRDRRNNKEKERYYKNIYVSRERAAKRTRKYTEKNREKINEKQRMVRAENRELARAKARDYYWKNREKRIQSHNEWLKKNKGKNREYKANRRAKVMQVGGRYTAKEFKELCDKYHNICLSCKLSLPLVADHVIPLSKGGSNSIDNIQPLCRHCNASKFTKNIDYRY